MRGMDTCGEQSGGVVVGCHVEPAAPSPEREPLESTFVSCMLSGKGLQLLSKPDAIV